MLVGSTKERAAACGSGAKPTGGSRAAKPAGRPRGTSAPAEQTSTRLSRSSGTSASEQGSGRLIGPEQGVRRSRSEATSGLSWLAKGGRGAGAPTESRRSASKACGGRLLAKARPCTTAKGRGSKGPGLSTAVPISTALTVIGHSKFLERILAVRLHEADALVVVGHARRAVLLGEGAEWGSPGALRGRNRLVESCTGRAAKARTTSEAATGAGAGAGAGTKSAGTSCAAKTGASLVGTKHSTSGAAKSPTSVSCSEATATSTESTTAASSSRAASKGAATR